MTAFRPQVFTTSRRLTPCTALRAYFIPLALPGFPLQGFSFSRSRNASRRPLPSCRYHRPASRCQATERQPVFRALLPRRRPPHSVTRLNTTAQGALLGFFLSRVFLPSAVGRLSAPLPSRASVHAVRDVVYLLHRVSPNRENGTSLARPLPLLRFSTSSTSSSIREHHRTWLMVSPRARRRVATTPDALLGPCWLPTGAG